MTGLLIRLFLPESVDMQKKRTRGGMLSGAVGIFVNVLLCAAKLFAGSISGSIAVTADAFNNLSDAASSCVTLVGFKLSGKPADDEHPFGHGRLEYICALIVTFLIFMMGFELVTSSFDRIKNPNPVVFDTVAAIILIASIAAKLWLAFFNRSLGKKINSPAMQAAFTDSLSDTAATLVSLISLILSKYTSLPLDGYFGIVVAAFIFIAGAGILKEASNPLLGRVPDKELTKEINDKILSYDGIVGVHDLIVHDYGPNRIFGSAHAEVPADVDIMISHDTIDCIEHDIYREMGIHMVLHLDPLCVGDEKTEMLKKQTEEALAQIDERLSMHDFRVVDGPTHDNVIFDVVIPHRYTKKHSEITALLEDKLSEGKDKKVFVVITLEESYI